VVNSGKPVPSPWMTREPGVRHSLTWQQMSWLSMVTRISIWTSRANSEAKGLHITQAGPDLIKKFAYLDAEIARRWDPQMAAIYYDQMMNKGKHHKQAVCACATHLLDRILAVLREDKAYEVRNVDGTPVTAKQARAIIAEHCTVPQEVRRRTTKRHRQEQAERQAERNRKGTGAEA
jgi:hypothetical protein